MSFKLCHLVSGAPATFQHLMMKVLRGICWKYILWYIDDVTIFRRRSRNICNTSRKYSVVYETLYWSSRQTNVFRKKKLLLPKTCSQEVRDRNRWKKGWKKCEFDSTKGPKRGKKFIGLNKLLQKKLSLAIIKYVHLYFSFWKRVPILSGSQECENALNNLKQALVSAPILAFPDVGKAFVLTCDASWDGLGYILGQIGENKRERAIEYGGRALCGSEKNYSVSEIECLAIGEGVMVYKSYHSTGMPFTIITEHKALTCLKSLTNSTNGRLARWSLFLQVFRYKIVYRKGEQNNADALSRLTKEVQSQETQA